MAYIGTPPSNAFTSLLKQDFSTSATTGYTLDHAVNNANDIALFINFVRQEPTAAYSASGTTLTLTSATASSDDMYCVYLGQALQTVNPPNASVGLSQLTASGTKDATTFLRGDNTFASAGGTNTPAFVSYVGSDQSLSNDTNTKVNYTTEHFDTDSAYDTSNKKFTVPSGQAGKYFISAGFNGNTDTTTKLFIRLYVNGSHTFSSMNMQNIKYRDNDSFIQVNRILDLSVGDYVEIYAKQISGSTSTLQSIGSWFQGYKLIT
jgi:hypothetical protein